jgi:dethiobiotin synthetase
MNRRGLFITGTDTGVGKTSVTAGLAAVLREVVPMREGYSVGNVQVWKPVQTGIPSAEAPESDSYRLRKEGGLAQQERDIATLTLPDPLAPWMAARRIGETIDVDALLAEGRSRLSAGDFLLIEGAGGLAVPLTERHLVADLAAGLGLPLLIVARPGLGTVNHTLLTVAAAKQSGIPIAGIVLNGYKHTDTDMPAVRENAEMIETFSGIPVVGLLPWQEEAGSGHPAGHLCDNTVSKPADASGQPKPDRTPSRWADVIRSAIDWETLLQL